MELTKKPLMLVCLMNATYGLAGSFIGIFIPIYLLGKNFNPANVFLYYLVFSLGILFFFFVTSKIFLRIGLRKTVLFNYPLIFLYFFLLYNFNQYNIPLYILALVGALEVSLYWFPLHIWLTNTSTEGEVGNDLAKFFAFSQTIGILAPVIGGFIVVTWGFKTLFILTSFVYLISAIPLFYLPEFKFQEKIEVSRLIKLFKQYPRYFFFEVLENLREDAEGIIWPVFIYITFKDILSIGYIGTIGALGSVLFMLLVGKHTDKLDKRKLICLGSIIMLIIWLVRLNGISPLSAYTLTLVSSFFFALIMVPMNSIIYTISKHEGAVNFIFFRECAVISGRVILYSIAFFAVTSIKSLFIITALACLGLLFFSRKNLDIKNEYIGK